MIIKVDYREKTFIQKYEELVSNISNIDSNLIERISWHEKYFN